MLQKCTNTNKSEICHQIETIQSKQREIVRFQKRECTEEWMGKVSLKFGQKQQNNIDSAKPQNLKKSHRGPKIFESRSNFFAKQTKDLEMKL